MSRRTVLVLVAGAFVLAGAILASTLATVDQARPDGPCPDFRWGCAEFEPDENIVIGALLPTTGPLASRGRAALAAAEDAVADAPPVFGRPFVLAHMDDACSYEAGSAAARIFATTESPTRPPVTGVVGTICRPSVQTAAQILTDSGVSLVSWYGGDLRFAEPAPRLSFLVRLAPAPDEAAARQAIEIVVEAVRQTAIRGPDGTVYVPRTAMRDVLREVVDGSSLASP